MVFDENAWKIKDATAFQWAYKNAVREKALLTMSPMYHLKCQLTLGIAAERENV